MERIKICPTSADTCEKLPNGKEWYSFLWLDILEILTPGAMVQLLVIQAGNITVHLDEEQRKRFVQILQAQIDKWKARMKDAAAAIKGLSNNVLSFLRNVVMQKNEDEQPD